MNEILKEIHFECKWHVTFIHSISISTNTICKKERMAEIVEFESLLLQFLNSNNDIHQQAECNLNELQKQPETLIRCLFEVYIFII